MNGKNILLIKKTRSNSAMSHPIVLFLMKELLEKKFMSQKEGYAL